MSHASKKGYRPIPTLTKDRQIKHVAVPVGGALDQIHRHRVNKAMRENRQAFREFKAQMRVAKKAIPLDIRAKVNWSKVQNVEPLPPKPVASS